MLLCSQQCISCFSLVPVIEALQEVASECSVAFSRSLTPKLGMFRRAELPGPLLGEPLLTKKWRDLARPGWASTVT